MRSRLGGVLEWVGGACCVALVVVIGLIVQVSASESFVERCDGEFGEGGWYLVDNSENASGIVLSVVWDCRAKVVGRRVGGGGIGGGVVGVSGSRVGGAGVE